MYYAYTKNISRSLLISNKQNFAQINNLNATEIMTDHAKLLFTIGQSSTRTLVNRNMSHLSQICHSAVTNL